MVTIRWYEKKMHLKFSASLILPSSVAVVGRCIMVAVEEVVALANVG